MYQQCLTAVIFMVCAYTDIKCRKVYKKVAAVYMALALAGRAVQGAFSLEELLSGMIPGLCAFALSLFTGQALGYGDSILIGICGISLGWEQCLGTVCAALLLSAVWAAGLLCLRKAGRKKEFPFVPFLLAGELLQCLSMGCAP